MKEGTNAQKNQQHAQISRSIFVNFTSQCLSYRLSRSQSIPSFSGEEAGVFLVVCRMVYRVRCKHDLVIVFIQRLPVVQGDAYGGHAGEG